MSWRLTKVSERIAEVETALVTRTRELVHSAGGEIEEEQVINDAMYALSGLSERVEVQAKPEKRL